jgi:hypothetical protein
MDALKLSLLTWSSADRGICPDKRSCRLNSFFSLVSFASSRTSAFFQGLLRVPVVCFCYRFGFVRFKMGLLSSLKLDASLANLSLAILGTMFAALLSRILYCQRLHSLSKFAGPWWLTSFSISIAIISLMQKEPEFIMYLVKKYGSEFSSPINVSSNTYFPIISIIAAHPYAVLYIRCGITAAWTKMRANPA